jgi:DNA polymerase-3 subunit delta
MSPNLANLVILHGEDELAISQQLSAVLAGMGDSAMAEMNTARLDGRTASMSDLETAVSTLPFLSPCRFVILLHPLARLASAGNKDKFKALLGRIPPSVRLVLVEYKSLTEESARKKHQINWLESWALQAGDRVEMHCYPLPRAADMPARIQAMAKAHQGQITPEAARQLAILVGENPRLADQELQKLQAYVNYSCPIQLDDVQHLIEDQALGDIFSMVDAMGNRSAKKAVTMFHRLLEEQDAGSIFAMVVRQFRLLLLAREIIDGHDQTNDVAGSLHLHPFVADKISAQARRFSLERLEVIYHRLLDMDTAIKTGEIDADLALDTMIASITL